VKLFRHGETVRLIGGFGTPSQRLCLWVILFRLKEDTADKTVHIRRQADPDYSMWVDRRHVTPATVLDILSEI
jgi:hypothetical protein